MSIYEFDIDSAQLVELAAKLPEGGLGSIARVQAGLAMLVALESINMRQNDDPVPVLRKAISDAKGVLSATFSIAPELDRKCLNLSQVEIGVGHTINLFENAWTNYTPETYEHSLKLVKERLKASGFDEQYFAGKNCFDGGCGTGRLAIAMAQMGAKNVTAIDLGAECLDYFRTIVERYGLKNIEIIEHDVTELPAWQDGAYDFVASNGVLHHTENCERGIREHFRITKPGGVFWVYLYGAGGMYWHLYDLLKPIVLKIPPADIRRILGAFGLREGLIYTYLDNFLAPRMYYGRDEFLKLLKQEGEFSWQHAKGMSEIDDTEKLLNTAYGAQIYGPQGEVRLVMSKA